MPALQSLLTFLRLKRADRLFWGALAIVFVITAFLEVRPLMGNFRLFGQYYDDAIYVVSARSLADGHGYHIESLPGDPPQTKYPIGYPLLLASVWKAFPSF